MKSYRRDLCRLPSILLLVTGLLLVGFGIYSGPSHAESYGDFSSRLSSLKNSREPYPELAVRNGFLVGADEASLRGGVSGYVDRPSGKERERLEAYREVGKFASFYRDEHGMLVLHLDRGTFFPKDSDELTPEARENLDELANLMRIEGIRTADIYGQADTLDMTAYNEMLSGRRAEAVKNYLEPRLQDADMMSYGASGMESEALILGE